MLQHHHFEHWKDKKRKREIINKTSQHHVRALKNLSSFKRIKEKIQNTKETNSKHAKAQQRVKMKKKK